MVNIQRKSNILPWSIENIIGAPSTAGVYVLRESLSIESIIYIGSVDNIERRLKEHFSSGDINGVLYFDWYEVEEGIEEARNLKKIWIEKYHPKFNVQHNI